MECLLGEQLSKHYSRGLGLGGAKRGGNVLAGDLSCESGYREMKGIVRTTTSNQIDWFREKTAPVPRREHRSGGEVHSVRTPSHLCPYVSWFVPMEPLEQLGFRVSEPMQSGGRSPCPLREPPSPHRAVRIVQSHLASSSHRYESTPDDRRTRCMRRAIRATPASVGKKLQLG
jgi:hypothetical protein